MNSLFLRIFILVRKSIYLTLGYIDSVMHRRSGIIILTYHSVSADGWRFSVDANSLKRQIAYLQKHYTFITLSDLKQHILGNKRIVTPAVVMTFDDGYKDILQMKSFFAQQHIRPALFILADTINANWKEIGKKRTFLSARDVKSLIAEGWEVGSHSSTHANLSMLNGEQLEDEVVRSKKMLEKTLGVRISYFAYPRGKYTKSVLTAVKRAGYTLGLTMDDGVIDKKGNSLLLPRIGVDNTHSFGEFTAAFSPSVIQFRKLVKQSFLGKYL